MIKQILLGLFLGIIATIASLQYDPYVQKVIGDGFKMAFEQALDCKLDCTVEYINLFCPTIALRDVTVTPSKDAKGWRWQAKKYVTQFTWPHTLLKGTVDLRVHMKDVIAETELENGAMAILPHLQKMAIGDPNVPLLLTTIDLDKSTFIVNDHAKKQKMALSWKSNTQRYGQIVSSHVTLLDGECALAEKKYIHDLNGTIECDVIETTSMPEFRIKSQCCVTVDHIFKEPLVCTLSGQWNENKKACSLHTNNHELAVDEVLISSCNDSVKADIKGRFPLELASEIARLLGTPISAIQGNGNFKAHVTFDASMPQIEGAMNVQNVHYKGIPIFSSVACSFSHLNNQIAAKISVQSANNGSIVGELQYHLQEKHGAFNLHNDAPITVPQLPGWQIKKDDCTLALHLDAQGNLDGNYQVRGCSDTQVHSIEGAIKSSYKKMKITGIADDMKYVFGIKFAPHYMLDELKILDAQNSALANFHADAQYTYGINGEIDLEIFKPLFIYAGIDMAARGKIQCKAHVKDSNIHGEIALKNGIVRIPNTYNCITHFDTTFDADLFAQKIIHCTTNARMQQGSISCKDAVIKINDQNSLAYVYLPILFDQCFIPVQKDIFATVSGNIIMRYRQNSLPTIKGHLFIDHAQIKQNILSAEFYKTVRTLIAQDQMNAAGLGINAQCDITLNTKEPIRISTNVLETDAQVSLHLYNTVQEPLLSGTINLINGALYLPYKPLFITKGTFTFVPGNLDNPMIEVIAQNTIKKHDITLQATGALKDYAFMAWSNPTLTDNQIASLLLVGSPDATLSTIVPAVASQTLKNVIFESNSFAMAHNDAFKKIMKPLRTVHLVPLFDDQAARGGIRGAFEIELGDRIKALIQKNFTLTEDTRFELEYMLSDEMSIRGIRDERRDVNAELEMRWKF